MMTSNIHSLEYQTRRPLTLEWWQTTGTVRHVKAQQATGDGGFSIRSYAHSHAQCICITFNCWEEADSLTHTGHLIPLWRSLLITINLAVGYGYLSPKRVGQDGEKMTSSISAVFNTAVPTDCKMMALPSSTNGHLPDTHQSPDVWEEDEGLGTTSVLFGESTFVTWRARMKWARVNSRGLLSIRILEYLWHCDFVVVERIWHKSICVCVCLLVYLLASYFIEVNQMNAIVDQHNDTMPVSLP